MALTYGDLSAITQDYFVPKMIDNIFDSNPLLARLRKSHYERLSGGTKVIVPVLYAATTSSGWYTGADTLLTDDNQQFTAAEFDWKQIYSNITVTGLDELKNGGKEQIVSLVKSKVQVAEKTMSDALGTGVFNAGTTTNAIIGLRLALAGTGYTYGGISKTTYSWFRGQTDAATTIATPASIEAKLNDATIGTDAPTVIVTTRDIYDDLWASLQPQQRFMDSDSAKAGFKSISINGISVVVDSHCPASHLFAINENYLTLYVHKARDFKFEAFTKPVNQDLSTAKIFWTGALACSNPRMSVYMSTLA